MKLPRVWLDWMDFKKVHCESPWLTAQSNTCLLRYVPFISVGLAPSYMHRIAAWGSFLTIPASLNARLQASVFLKTTLEEGLAQQVKSWAGWLQSCMVCFKRERERFPSSPTRFTYLRHSFGMLSWQHSLCQALERVVAVAVDAEQERSVLILPSVSSATTCLSLMATEGMLVWTEVSHLHPSSISSDSTKVAGWGKWQIRMGYLQPACCLMCSACIIDMLPLQRVYWFPCVHAILYTHYPYLILLFPRRENSLC